MGPLWFSAGIVPRNVLTLFYSAAMAIGFINLLALILIPTAQSGVRMVSDTKFLKRYAPRIGWSVPPYRVRHSYA